MSYELVLSLTLMTLISIMIGIGISKLRRTARLRKEKKYRFEYKCFNCRNPEFFEIQIGVYVKEFLTGKKCSRCGCNL